jgi:uncharacterized membrane protein YphA (DoxX/SURF4 family)
MNNLVIPIGVMYAGLAGALLALIVAAATNGWSLRVFFLLALRLAIGWQFLFEGLYKVQTHYGPPNETSRPFSSEPYFKAAPGPIGAYMRKQFDDPAATISEKLTPGKEFSPGMFGKLPLADQAAACPAAVAQQLDGMETAATEAIKAEAEKRLTNAVADEAAAIAKIEKTEKQELSAAKTDEDKEAVKQKMDLERGKTKAEFARSLQDAQKRADNPGEFAREQVLRAKAAYARWVYGADGRDTKVKFVTGDVALTVPQRLVHIEHLRQELRVAEANKATELGNGFNIDTKRTSDLRMELIAAESELAKDANSFIADLKKDLNGGKTPEVIPHTSRGQWMDHVTMWFLVAVGACLMLGLFTRLACVLAAGFLVMTYLAFPPFPWYTQPPNTEGNPLFINKNAIECLALLALACMPTGRWLGLDALVLRPFCCRGTEPAAVQPVAVASPRSGVR